MYQVILVEETEMEVRDAQLYCESIDKELGYKFKNQLTNSIRLLENSPLIYRTRFGNVRLSKIKIFPYVIYFTIYENKKIVNILRLRHEKRDSIFD